MSFSVEIRNGDLGLSGNSLSLVSGPQKLVQDLKCAILTPLGTYPNQPAFGSILTDEESDEILGSEDWELAATKIKAELNRVLADYQKQQVSRNQFDSSKYGRFTITPDETLLGVQEMKFVRIQDRMVVSVILRVGQEETIQLNIPIENGS